MVTVGATFSTVTATSPGVTPPNPSEAETRIVCTASSTVSQETAPVAPTMLAEVGDGGLTRANVIVFAGRSASTAEAVKVTACPSFTVMDAGTVITGL